MNREVECKVFEDFYVWMDIMGYSYDEASERVVEYFAEMESNGECIGDSSNAKDCLWNIA